MGVITATFGEALLLMGLQQFGGGDPMSIAVATVATAAVRLLAIRYAVNQSSLSLVDRWISCLLCGIYYLRVISYQLVDGVGFSVFIGVAPDVCIGSANS